MSRELRDLIESVDSANKAHSDLVTMIRYLKEELQRLNQKIIEQKQVISNQGKKIISYEESDVPEDTKVLKEIVTMQRDEISKKDKAIELLENNIDELTKSLENQTKDEDTEALVQANRIIAEITQDNSEKALEIEDLKVTISELKERNQKLREPEDDIYQDLIDAKKVIFQLTEETGIKQVKIESLKAELDDYKTRNAESSSLKEQYQEELQNAKNNIDNITIELESANDKIDFLKEKLENTIKIHENEKAKILEQSEEYVRLNENASHLENEINSLNHELMERNEALNVQAIEIEDLVNIISDLKIAMKNDQVAQENELSLKEKNLEDLNKRLIEVEAENERLTQEGTQSREKEHKMSEEFLSQKSITPSNNFVPSYLFLNMINLMGEKEREIIFNQLVNTLDADNRELRTNSIKLLSLLSNDQSFDILKALVHDSDWIIKLYLIKALEKFKNPEIIDLLKELKNDNDPDVREIAEASLKRLT